MDITVDCGYGVFYQILTCHALQISDNMTYHSQCQYELSDNVLWLMFLHTIGKKYEVDIVNNNSVLVRYFSPAVTELSVHSCKVLVSELPTSFNISSFYLDL